MAFAACANEMRTLDNGNSYYIIRLQNQPKFLGAHGIRNETTNDVNVVFVALTRDVQDVISCTNESKFQRIIK